MADKKLYDVLVIGAGQAGLAAGYFLQKSNLSFIILDKATHVGQSWSDRYDSLKLFSPNAFNSLPGLEITGNTDGYPSKDEVAAYLKNYVKKFELPIELENQVLKLEKSKDCFVVTTDKATYYAKRVIIATGPFQKAQIPAFAGTFGSSIFQIHTADYKNQSQILAGKILIIGTGNSGAQIAVELSNTHKVTIACRSKPKFFPYTFLGKSWLWWTRLFGLLHARTAKWPVNIVIGQWHDPIIGTELKKLIKDGKIKLKPAVIGVMDNKILFADNSREQFTNIIWATGFRHDFSWVKIPGIVDNRGKPMHKEGVSPVPDLYFIGLKHQITVSSGLIHGAGSDAQYIVKKILETKIKL